MTHDEKIELTRELEALYGDGLTFETSIEELDILLDTPEYKLAKDLWDAWDSEK